MNLITVETEVLRASVHRRVQRRNNRAPWIFGNRSVTEAVKGLKQRHLVWIATDDNGRQYVVPTAAGEAWLARDGAA